MENIKHIPQSEFEIIERYLTHDMDAQERAAFNSKLNENPILATQVEEVKSLLLGIESAVLAEKLDTFHEDVAPVKKLSDVEKPKSNESVLKKAMVYAMAASIILALGVFWFMSQDTNSEKLYAKYFTPDPGLPTTMSSTSEYDFYEAMVDYKQEKYGVAIEKWERLLPEKSDNDTLNYFLGVAKLANSDQPAAIEHLSKTVNNPESVFYKEAYHYLGWAHLLDNDIESARESFRRSTLSKSKEILRELNK